MYTKRMRKRRQKQIGDKLKNQEQQVSVSICGNQLIFSIPGIRSSPRIPFKKRTYSSNKKILFIFEAYGADQENQRKDYTIVMGSATVRGKPEQASPAPFIALCL